MLRPISIAAVFCLMLFPLAATAQRVLFDARHGQTAGNADWIVDADSAELEFLNFQCQPRSRRHSSGQRMPSPPQSEITPETPETFWHGGISAWAVDLAKDALKPERDRDWRIEQYPWNAPPMTYGNPAHTQDLANYDVLILCEPNLLFEPSEEQAIREFVWNGGGLFLCADHETSDRNCSGRGVERHDSPFILNRLMQTDVETSRTPPYFDPASPDNDFGVFGIWFYENDNDDGDDTANRAFDWFTEAVNNNVTSDPDDPILHGPFGDGTGGLGLFGSTQMAVSRHAEKGNPSARPHIWRNGQSQTANAVGTWERVTFASSTYGAGRVVAVGDSSPADDDTGDGNLHPGWNKASGGVANDRIFLNATEWLANVAPDATPPVLTAGPAASPEDCRATVRWVTDEPANSRVEWGVGTDLRDHVEDGNFSTGHEVQLPSLQPETRYAYRILSTDAADNGPTISARHAFTTTARIPFTLNSGPQVTVRGHDAVSVAWSTSKPTLGEVRFAHESEAERHVASTLEMGRHDLTLTGLAPSTRYRFRVLSTDACGETVQMAHGTFTTPERPPSRNLSGWRLVNTNTNFEFTLPPGASILAGGYLVIGRDADQAEFETEWGALPPAATYLNAGNRILVNATPRPYQLFDADGGLVDGSTITVRSGQSIQRRSGCADPGAAAAWQAQAAAEGGPGRGPLTACGAGVIISEIADGRDFLNEFVELHFDP